jgi:hypothetical protein
VLGQAGLQPRAEEADQVTRNWTIAPVRLGLPLAIRQSGPAAPDGIRSQAELGASRDHGSTALESAPAEQHPQQMEEPQISTARHGSDHTRQHPIATVEYGGQQVRSLQGEID